MPASAASFTLATTAALQANTAAWPTVLVQGYHSATDGVSRVFVYVASDTTSSDNGGTIIEDASGHRYHLSFSGSVSVDWFGAYGDGTHDDTTAINNCITYCIANNQTVALSAKTYLVSALVANSGSANLRIQGAGRSQTVIKTSSATANVLSLTLGNSDIRDLTIGSSATRTGGAHIVTACNIGNLVNVGLDGFFHGIQGNDNGGTWRDLLFTDPASSATGCIVNGYPVALVIDNAQFYLGSYAPSCGIQIVECGAVQMNNCDITGYGTDLLINPGNGQTVASVFAENSFFDTATYGMAINPSGTGSVVRCKFTNCWTCSHTQTGVLIENSGTGTLAGIEFVNHIAGNNIGYGVNLAAGVGISFIGGSFAGNDAGIGVEAGVTDFTIMGVQAGAYGGFSGNTTYGIIVATGASNRYIVASNRTTGNTTDGVSDGGSGSDKFVGNNIT